MYVVMYWGLLADGSVFFAYRNDFPDQRAAALWADSRFPELSETMILARGIVAPSSNYGDIIAVED